MGKIIILDEITANKIAAGEVVERPASVVKELVENSLDAGATSITVEIRNGGISYIKVMDNGSGMEEDDVGIAFERHSTSKIKYADDIESITSMGFRGEALASIASVSSVLLTTRTSEKPHGTSIEVKGGHIIDIKPSGCPVGTTIIVRDLFFNTPARFKFLKKDTTEAGYITDVIGRIALGNPNVAFKLTNNGTLVLHTPGNNDPISSIFSIYGRETAGNVYEINYQDGKIKVSGYVGKPEIARSTRNHQSLFLNRRYIRSKIVTTALDEAYNTFLMKSKYPFSVINLEINPVLVDVNVHPSKMEVKFSNEQDIFKAVYHAVNNALLTKSGIRQASPADRAKNPFRLENTDLPDNGYKQQSMEYERPVVKPEIPAVKENPSSFAITEHKKTNEIRSAISQVTTVYDGMNNTNSVYKPVAADWSIDGMTPDAAKDNAALIVKQSNATVEDTRYGITDIKNSNKYLSQFMPGKEIIIDKSSQDHGSPEYKQITTDIATPDHTNDTKSIIETEVRLEEINELTDSTASENKSEISRLSDARIIGQVFNTYILLQQQDQLLLIDQHAAHERVVYEELKDRIRNKKPVSQNLLAGQVIELTRREIELINAEKELIQGLGFDFEAFGTNSIILRAVPVSNNGNSREIFLEVVDSMALEGKNDKKLLSDEAIYNIACKAAVKANKKLDQLEIESLLARLSDLENPYTCPHGRPSVIKISKYELEKMFKRIV